MKNSKQLFLAAGLALVTTGGFAQKAMETSAAVEYKNNFMPALQSGDQAKAKSSILKAKGYIDAAAAHADTKESPKTLFYKGEIYFILYTFKEAGEAEFAEVPADALDQSLAAYNKAYTVSNKMDADIEQAIQQKRMLLDMAAVEAFKQKKYTDAMDAYDLQVKVAAAVNELDSNAIYSAGICAENATEWEKAATYYSRCADIGYKVPEIYKTTANALIQAKKTEEATAFLAKAIEKSPNDKELYYVIGTFYMDMGQNEKATENLRKAVELDPKYWDAQYQLGAHLLELANKTRKEANNLPLKDPNFDKLIAQSTEYYKQALVPLEAYIAAVPNDKAVLTCLYQIYRALKNPEKEAEYKKRADEAK